MLKTESERMQRDGVRSNWVLSLLLLAYILSFIDRNVMSLLVGPIRQEFDISDFEYSLLHGLAFTMLYILLGLPFGWLADRSRRKWIISLGVGFWSLMTCLSGFAKSFTGLFVARMGVGIGEATLSPAAYSMLSDLYSPRRLRWATSVFAMGITLGSGLSYLIGGWLLDFYSSSDLSAWPILGELKPWQLTFISVGMPGVLVMLLLMSVKEPARVSAIADDNLEPVSLGQTFAWARGRWQLYLSIALGVSGMAVTGYGQLIWYPEMLFRTYDVTKSEVGTSLGLIFMVAGTAGTFFGAGFASFLARCRYQDANLRTLMYSALLSLGPASLASLMESPLGALSLISFAVFFHYMHFGVVIAGLQLVTPNRMRAQYTAALLFLSNLFGLAMGGSIVAFLTDFVFGADEALRYSLAWVAAISYAFVVIVMLWGLPYYSLQSASSE